MNARRAGIETLIATLDARTEDFGDRLQRFSSLLDESLDAASSRAREIASIVAETSNDSVQVIEHQYELVRTASEEERKRTGETLHAVYDEATAQIHTMFTQSADRYAEIMQGMKQMAAEMQQELETTRAELRRGIFELPQETAESAAQMRRVIVDQIEALAELNRIVARHGRSLDTVEAARAEPTRREADPLRREPEPLRREPEPMMRREPEPMRREPEPVRREPEPAYAAAPARAPARPARADITAAPPPAMRGDITGAPPRRPEAPQSVQQNGGNGRNGGSGWLSDLLTRASREDSPPIAPSPREGGRADERTARDGVDFARVACG